jgi:hypothetical protein
MSLTSPPGRSSEEDAVLWNSLRSGEHFAMLRHAIAPGTGDPSGFKLDNCRTQRNLSEEARNQAVKIGKLFREEWGSEGTDNLQPMVSLSRDRKIAGTWTCSAPFFSQRVQ